MFRGKLNIDKYIQIVYPKHKEGATGRRLVPFISYRKSNRRLGAGRLLLFYLKNQTNYANDNKSVCKHIRISYHRTAPLSEEQRAKKLPPVGANRLPLQVAVIL